MFAQWNYKLRLLIERISIRERVLVMVALMAAILMIAQLSLFITGLDKHETVIKRTEQHQSQSAQLRQALQELEASVNDPRIAILQQNIADLQRRISTLQIQVSEIDSRLIAPEQMVQLLQELIEQSDKLALVSFEVLPLEIVTSNAEERALFYQHGIAMELEGEFEAFSNYLLQIENIKNEDGKSSQLFWDELIIHTEDYPKLRIQLKVHTLSQDQEWLNV